MELSTSDSNYFYHRSVACALMVNLYHQKELLSLELAEWASQKLRSVVNENLDCFVIKEYQGILHRYGCHVEALDQRSFEMPETRGFYIFRPVSSGFFSIVENIVNAKIQAAVRGHKLMIDLGGGWWPYKDKFQHIFKGAFEYYSGSFSNIFAKRMNFYKSRQWFLNLPKEYWAHYEILKAETYKSIYADIMSYAADSNLISNDMDYQYSELGVYIRRGDKIDLESLDITKEVLKQHFSYLSNKFTSCYLSSDDVAWVKQNFTESFQQLSWDDVNTAGYFYGRESSIDHQEIIKKYIKLASCGQMCADVGSNLINAIAYTRMGLNKEPIYLTDLFPTPAIPLF